jgi:autotransporter-associated beta strand protein
MSLTKTGTGTQTLSGNNTYTGLTNVGISGVGGTLVLTGTNMGNGNTSVAAGTLLVNGSTTSNTSVSGTGILGGTGVINGTVTLAAGSSSTFAPGSPITSTADIATQSLTIDSGATFSVQVNGPTPNTQHDQVIVTGTVIHGNSTLQTSGTITSSPGQQIVLIANDGVDAVTGQFLGLAEGATVTINGVNFFLSYQGGLGGNDVTLTQAGPVNYTSDGLGAGALELRLNAGSVQFVDDGVVVDSRPLASLLNQTITVTGTNGQNETLTVNYAFGGFFNVNVVWNGGVGAADNDALNVIGGTFTTITHTFTTTGPENSGNIVYTTGAATATITYSGLEPVAMNSTATNLIFNLPTGTNVATLADDGNANDGISQLTSGGTFESTTFAHPTGSLTINGNTGADTFTINGLDTLAPPTVVINGGTGNDVLNGTVIDAVVLSTVSAPNANGFAGSENSFGMTFSGINTITGNGGTLIGRDVASTWNLDGTPTYENGTNVLNFTGFATLIGGSGADTFNVSFANSPFNLNGGDGADVFSFTNTGSITGAVDGGAGTNDTLVGDNDGNVFDVTGADSGTLATKMTGWSNVENLTGGTGVDTFTVQAAGSLTGAISALSSTDTLDLSAVAGASATVAALSNTGASLTAVTNVGGGATGIDNLIGSGTGTLTGENATRTWNLGATQTYTNGPNTLTFAGFATLQGGSGADTFNVTVDPASVTQINGGAGADLFDIDVTLTAAINGEAGSDTLQGNVVDDVLLTGSDANGFDGTEADINGGIDSFDGIDALIANGGTLTGRDVPSTWDLDGTPTYSDGTVTLSIAGFDVLQGGLDVDTFNVTAASDFDLLGGAGFDVFNINATLTGLIDGQGGLDTLQGSRINLVVLTGSDGDGFDGTEADITGNFDGIDTINGTLTGTLTGENVASTWLLDGTPTYDDGANTLNFTGFQFLQGGIDVDTFELTADSAYVLNGGDGDDVFTMNAVLSGAVFGGAGIDLLQGDSIGDVRLFDSNDDGFAGFASPLNASFFTIDSIIGNGTGRLTGQDVNSFWELDGTPTYTNAAGHVLDIDGFAILQGGSGVDTFEISAASDFDIFGGDGNDFITFLAGGSLSGTANGDAGVDRLNASLASAAVVMFGGEGNDFLTGSNFNDFLSGDNGNDLINGGNGNDTLSGGLSNDTINGGAGIDQLTETTTTLLTLTNTTLTGVGNDKLSSIESAELFGNDNNNTLDASKFTVGRVTLHGGAGNDTLIGTNYDADTNVDGFHDELDGGDGFDTVKQSSTTNQSITVGPDPDTFVATGAGTDLWRSIEAAFLSGTGKLPTTLNGSGFTGNLTLSGGSGNDLLIGGTGPNYLNGNAGNDELIGGASLDTLLGGAGNDTLDGRDGNDVLKGGDGNDRMLGGQGEDVLYGEAGNDKIFGGDGDDFLDGGAGNDTLTGDAGDDLINGGAGNDAIHGRDGDDTITGNGGNDTILGGSGDDVLKGGGGFDKISGESGNDRIETTNSTVATGSGNDTIIGSGNKIDEAFSFDFEKLLL